MPRARARADHLLVGFGAVAGFDALVRPEDAARTDDVEPEDFAVELRLEPVDDVVFDAVTRSAASGALRGDSVLAVASPSVAEDLEVTMTSTRRLFSFVPSGRSGPKLMRPMCEPVTPLWSR